LLVELEGKRMKTKKAAEAIFEVIKNKIGVEGIQKIV
jgi:hypothetical protein